MRFSIALSFAAVNGVSAGCRRGYSNSCRVTGERSMRIRVIACEVLFREICQCAARARSVIDLTFLRRGLHSNPDTLRDELQRVIDETDEECTEAIALGYGLCSNGAAGLRARGIPLVVPRAHDCITLLLGSREAYDVLFSQRPGTYYYSGGWVERGADKVPRTAEDGAGLDVPFEDLVAKYGLDNAQYLWELQSSWIKRYTHATYIDSGVGDTAPTRSYTQSIAQEHGWVYEDIPGELALLQDFLDGSWDDERFLTVPPGHIIIPTVDARVVRSEPAC
jgi:hypothetical protein